MAVTILAVTFLLVLLAIAAFGFKAIIRQGRDPQDLNKERCSLCREQFLKAQLIERQVGDYKLLFFCSSCVIKLHAELTGKN